MKKDDERLVTLAEFATRFEAGLARGALEALGIPVLVPEEHMPRASHAGPARLGFFTMTESAPSQSFGAYRFALWNRETSRTR